MKILRRIKQYFFGKSNAQLWLEACVESEEYHLSYADRFKDPEFLKMITRESARQALRRGPLVSY